MRQTKIYKYSSSHGTIITPINLEMGNPTISYRLTADAKKILTNGTIRVEITEVVEEDIKLWEEVDKTEEELALEEEFKQNEKTEEVNYKELLDIIVGEEDDLNG